MKEYIQKLDEQSSCQETILRTKNKELKSIKHAKNNIVNNLPENHHYEISEQ